jgi:hypothetical protein
MNGIELNNYRYEENIRYAKNPPLVYKDVIEYSKNKTRRRLCNRAPDVELQLHTQ